MISDKLYKAFLEATKYRLTSEQKEVLKQLAEFILSEEERIFILKGYAGTGKTTIIQILSSALSSFEMPYFLLAPTGRAAKVISEMSHKPAYTIHKHIYRKNTAKGWEGKFTLDLNKSNNTIYIVDEASMIHTNSTSKETSLFGSGSLLDDLISYVFNTNNNKLLLVGDSAQLPPVTEAESLALSKSFVEKYGYKVDDYELTTVMRQAAQSGIINNATSLRKMLSDYHYSSNIPQLTLADDVIKPDNSEVWDYLSLAFSTHNKDDSIIITVSNKTANIYNQTIRRRIFDYEDEITEGDMLMVVRNNYKWAPDNAPFSFIANGDFIRINKIYEFEEKYGFHFADVNISLQYAPDFSFDTKLLLDSIHSKEASLSFEQRKKLYSEIESKLDPVIIEKFKRFVYKKMMQNPYFNALEVKFAYAITCHKAQGGQWNTVFIDQGHFNFAELDTSYIRWLYTAITRAKEKLFLINFDKKFFEQ